MTTCKKWHLGPFTISVCHLKYWSEQLTHFVIHFAIAFVLGIILLAFNMEGDAGTGDGFRKFNDDGNEAEGFNVYPDLVFRGAGAYIGGIFF